METIYVPYDGYPDLSRFNTFDLSEIVVSKGFTSVLYGPNTIGGAINLVSRNPLEEFLCRWVFNPTGCPATSQCFARYYIQAGK